MATTPVAPPSDSLVRKIQLLLNLASRPEGNEVEAAAAMARAQELLAQYNLDLATVQDKVVAGGATAREAESRRDYAHVNRSAMYKWQQRLVRALAEANFCVYWVTETTEHVLTSSRRKRASWDLSEQYQTLNVKRHKVLGRVANTAAVMVMVDYLLDTIERLLPYPQQERMSRGANYWREGCADRLCERIAAKAAAMRKADYSTQGEAVYSTAIQVADLARKEEVGNYEHIYGAGSWAKKLAREAESEKYWSAEAVAARKAERKAALDVRRALETPEQKAKREKEEAKEAERARKASERYSRSYWARQDREEEREAARKDSDAYRAGQAKGESIGLDAQAGAGAKQKGLA